MSPRQGRDRVRARYLGRHCRAADRGGGGDCGNCAAGKGQGRAARPKRTIWRFPPWWPFIRRWAAPQTEIVLPGNIQAFIDSPIYARTNGYLKKWYADIGTHVKAGTTAGGDRNAGSGPATGPGRADLNTAQANSRLAEITATRYQDLAKTEAVSKQDVDNAVGRFRGQEGDGGVGAIEREDGSSSCSRSRKSTRRSTG